MSSSTNYNDHGLSRYIPTDVSREIRQKSKFGCVICRNAIYQYEHIDPEFKDAHKHDPDKICLLCGGCHDKVSRGRISKETVLNKYKEIQNNNSIQKPFESLDLRSRQLKVSIGSNVFEYTPCIFEIDGRKILSISPGEDQTGFPLIDGIFFDENGKEIFRISNNIWEGPLDLWDIEIQGKTTTIKSVPKKVALEFEIDPPDHISITKIDMIKDNCHIVCKDDQILIGQLSKKSNVYIGLNGFQCNGADIGIQVDSRKLIKPKPTGLKMVGGKGIVLEGTGIQIGKNSGQMIIGGLQLYKV